MLLFCPVLLRYRHLTTQTKGGPKQQKWNFSGKFPGPCLARCNKQTIWNELPIFSTEKSAQTGRRIGTDSLHERPRAEQIGKIWLAGRWDVDASGGWEEGGRASEEDHPVTGTGPYACLDVNDYYYFPLHLFMHLFKQTSFQTFTLTDKLSNLKSLLHH